MVVLMNLMPTIPALELIERAKEQFNRRFAEVRYCNEGVFAPAPDVPHGTAPATYRFTVYLCGIPWANGERLPRGGYFSTAGEAVEAFSKNTAAIKVNSGDVLIWRRLPELLFDHDAECVAGRFAVGCRFAIIPMKLLAEM